MNCGISKSFLGKGRACMVTAFLVENKQIGLQKSKDAGAGITSVETVLFELLKDAQKEEFKEILNIVK